MYQYDRRIAGHSGEVDLTSPVTGKAQLVFTSPDFDDINYMLPAGAVPQKWVDGYLSKLVGSGYDLKALQSHYPKMTKTLEVTHTKYRLSWNGKTGPTQSPMEIELRVKK